MPRHSPCALFCFNFSPVYFYTLDSFFDCMSFANRLFYSIVVHPYYSKKPSCSSLDIFYLPLSVFTLPWEFFSLFSCARFAFLLFDFQCTLPFGLVGSSGFEPPTLRLSGVRSNHLSYEPFRFGLLFRASAFFSLLSPRCRLSAWWR